MIAETNYRNYFLDIYNYYNSNINKISSFNFDNIYICTNMKNGLSQLNIEYYGDLPLGATILPINHFEEMIILIEITNGYNYEDARRLIHELTYAYDFIKYAIFFTNGKIQNFRNQQLFHTYELFSEFRAFGCDEIYAYKYSDTILNKNNLDKEMKNQDRLLNMYIDSKRKQLLSKALSDYDLFQVLGKIFAFDKYNQIELFSDSLVYKYIPMLFKRINSKYIFELYEVCFESIIENSIFKNLNKIEKILNFILS